MKVAARRAELADFIVEGFPILGDDMLTGDHDVDFFAPAATLALISSIRVLSGLQPRPGSQSKQRQQERLSLPESAPHQQHGCDTRTPRP